jgi:diacylglycerol kinase (ATP)
MPVEPVLRFLFVINPISGGNDKTQLAKDAMTHFEQKGHVIKSFELNGKPEDCDEIKKMVTDWKPDRVVAIGGDGTLKIVAEQLIGTDIPIGLIPAGSANGMATEFGMTGDLSSYLETIEQCNIQPLDAIIINEKEVCIHMGDIGLNAQLVKKFEQSGTRGKWGYLREVFFVLLRRKQLKVSITADGKLYPRKAFMIVLANARMYGMGTMVNPDGNFQDGIMEIVIVKRVSLWELLKMFFKFRHFNPRKIEIVQAKEVKITSKNNAWFQVDGESLGKTREVRAYVQKHALKMILPKSE